MLDNKENPHNERNLRQEDILGLGLIPSSQACFALGTKFLIYVHSFHHHALGPLTAPKHPAIRRMQLTGDARPLKA